MPRVSPTTVRRWRDRWGESGVAGLVPPYPRRRAHRVRAEQLRPLIEHVRRELGDGAARFRLRLQRVHQARLAMGTIERVFRDLGLPRLRRTHKRMPRQLKLFERPNRAIASRST